MFSKRVKFILLAFALSTSLSGCAGENQPFTERAEFSFGKVGGQCLSEFGKTIDDYINSKISVGRLTHFWNCTYSSLQMFADFVSGQNPGYYTDVEIQNFLETYFLPDDEEFSTDLVHSLLEIKRIFIGGVSNKLTKSEIRQSKEILGILKSASIRALPYMKLYSFSADVTDNKSTYSEHDVEAAIALLQSVAQEVSTVLERVNEDYSFAEFQKFIDVLEKDMNPLNEGRNEFSKFIPVTAALKSILISKENEVEYVRGSEWRAFFFEAFQAYGMAIRTFYFLDAKTWFTGQGLNQLQIIVKNLFEMLERGIVNNEGEIPHTKVDMLIDKTLHFIEFPFGLPADSIKKLWRKLVQNLLQPGPLENKLIGTGYDYNAHNTLRYEYGRWLEAQNYVNDSTPSYSFSNLLRRRTDDNFDAIDEMQRVMESPVKMVLNSLDRIQLSNDSEEFEYDLASLSSMNWQKSLARIFIRSYVKDEDRRRDVSYLKNEEILAALLDFEELVFALQLVKKGKDKEEDHSNIVTFVENMLVEANLFLPNSSGDLTLNLKETVQYIIYALSGLNSAQNYFQMVLDACLAEDRNCKTETNEKEEVVSVDYNFYKKYFNSNADPLISHMPQMNEFFNNLEEGHKFTFMNYLEETIGMDKNPKFINIDNLTRLCVLMQYIETLIVMYDSDSSGHLDFDEATVAFPLFKDLLKEFSKDVKTDKRAEAVYYYLIHYGKIPTTLIEKIKFALKWEKKPEKWRRAQADRNKIARIIAVIKSQVE